MGTAMELERRPPVFELGPAEEHARLAPDGCAMVDYALNPPEHGPDHRQRALKAEHPGAAKLRALIRSAFEP